MIREEKELLSEVTDEYVDALVNRAVIAQKEFQTWSEEATDQLLYALAICVYEHAEELAIAAVQETGMGNVRDKTAKNRIASLEIYRSLTDWRAVQRTTSLWSSLGWKPSLPRWKSTELLYFRQKKHSVCLL